MPVEKNCFESDISPSGSTSDRISKAIHLVREDKTSLQSQIADQLASLIQRGILVEDEKLPTHRTLAQSLAVSPLTVSRAYGLLQSRGLLVQRQGRGTHVRVNNMSQKSVALLLLEWKEIAPYASVVYAHHQFMAGIEQACQEHDLRLHVMSVSSSLGEMDAPATLARIREEHDGVLTVMDTHEPLLSQLAHEGFPAMLFLRHATNPQVSNCCFNWTDALYKSTTHLIKQGRKRIGYIGPYKQDLRADDGFRGYFNAMVEHGLPLDPNLWIRCSNITQESSCRKEISQMIEDGHLGDAIVCHASAACEIGSLCLELLCQHGVRVPQDVAVVGFDEPYRGPRSDPRLTWIYVPRFEIGHAAMHALWETMKWPSHSPIVRQIDAQLVVGQSCGAAQATENQDLPAIAVPSCHLAELELVGL